VSSKLEGSEKCIINLKVRDNLEGLGVSGMINKMVFKEIWFKVKSGFIPCRTGKNRGSFYDLF
jgi:hypothetical protein